MFQQLLDTNKIEKAPISEVIKKQPKEIILSAFLRMSEQAPFYIFTAFIFSARSHQGRAQSPRDSNFRPATTSADRCNSQS